MKPPILLSIAALVFSPVLAMASPIIEMQGGTVSSAIPSVSGPTKMQQDDSHVRALQAISHVREEFNKAGCPSYWNSGQCGELLRTMQEFYRYAGPQGTGNVTLTGGTFYQNNYEKDVTVPRSKR